MAEAQIQHDAAAAPRVTTRSRREDFRRVFFSNRLALFGAAVMSLFILMAIFAPLIAPYDPFQQDLAGKFAPPSRAHLMGQDELGIWTSPDGSSKIAFFSDPDGNVLTLSEG